MKRVFLGSVLAAAVYLLASVPASAAEVETFVGCNYLAGNPVPSHVCQSGDSPGAFFESDEETEFEVCVELPTTVVLCTDEFIAEAEVLYSVSLPNELTGNYLVSWYTKGVEIGSWAFRLDPPPPPPVPPVTPAPVTPAPVTPAPLVVAPAPSAECLKAQHLVDKLKQRLRSASGHKQKTKLRAKLKSARAAEKRAC
jgi:hypothetical protein